MIKVARSLFGTFVIVDPSRAGERAPFDADGPAGEPWEDLVTGTRGSGRWRCRTRRAGPTASAVLRATAELDFANGWPVTDRLPSAVRGADIQYYI